MDSSFQIRESFGVSASTIYEAWLDSDKHSKMTGGEAYCSDKEGGSFTAWDGYISGKNLHLTNNQKIIQSWRTNDFNNDEKDSEIKVVLKPTKNGCELILDHYNIPDGQPDYKQGWLDHYLIPMKKYFEN